MKNALKTLAFLCLFVTTGFSQEFSDVFSLSVKPHPWNGSGEVTGIKQINDGAILVGNWKGTYNMNPRGTEANISSTEQGVFLARYDADGELVWKVAIDGADDDHVTDFAYLESTSPDGGVYISGHYASSTLLFPNSATSTSGTTIYNKGGEDVFVAKYDVDGDLQWAEGFGSTDDDYCTTVDVGLFDDNNTDKIKFAIAGYLEGTNNMDIDPHSSNAFNVSSSGGTDAWLAVYEDNGSSMTFESGDSYGHSQYDEDITAITLEYPKTYVTSNFSGNAGYTTAIQHAGGCTGCTSCSNAVTAEFNYGYTSPNPISSRGLIIKHQVNAGCNTIEAKWAIDPITLNGGATTNLSVFKDIQWHDGYVFFAGHKIKNPVSNDDRFPQYGILDANDGSLHKSIENVAPKNIINDGGTINRLKVIDGEQGTYMMLFGGETSDDLEFGSTTYSFGANEAFLFTAHMQSGGSTIFEVPPYTFGSEHNGRITAIDLSKPSYDDFNCSFAGAFNGTFDLMGSKDLNSVLEGSETDIFWSNYFLENTGSPSPSESLDYGYDLFLPPSAEVNAIAKYTQSTTGARKIYALITFDGILELNSTTAITSGGLNDVVLVKYDDMGVVDWYKHYSGNDDIVGADVECSSAGSVYVTGMFKGTAQLGDGSNHTATPGTSSGYDVFVDRFQSTGTHAWSGGTLLATSTKNVEVTDLELRANASSFFLSGIQENDLTISSTTLSGQGEASAFVWGLAKTGTTIWNYAVDHDVTGTTSDPIKLQYDLTSTHILLAINFRGQITAGTNTYTSTLDDAAIISLDGEDGNYKSIDLLSGNGNQRIKDINKYSDPSYVNGTLTIVATFKNQIVYKDILGSSITQSATALTDLFIGKMYPNSGFDWVNRFENAELDETYKLTAKGDQVYILGRFSGSFAPNPIGTSSVSPINSNDIDLFSAAYSLNDGTYVTGSLKHITGEGNIGLNNIARFDEDLLIAGDLTDEIDFSSSVTLAKDATDFKGYIATYDLCTNTPSNYSGPSLSVCLGIPVDLNALLPTTHYYHWYEDNGSGQPATEPLNANNSVCTKSVENGEDLWVQVVDKATGCKSGKTKVTFINLGQDKPIVTGSTALCDPISQSSSVTLELSSSISYTTSPTTTLKWQKTIFGTWTDQKTCPYANPNNCSFTISRPGSYRLAITDGGCYSSNVRKSNIVTITAPYALGITSNSLFLQDCPATGEDVNLNVYDNSSFSYNWEKESTTSPGTFASTDPADNDKKLEDVITRFGEGVYRCKITDNNGCSLYTGTRDVTPHPELPLSFDNGIVDSKVINSSARFRFTDDIYKFGSSTTTPVDRYAFFYYQGRRITNSVLLDPDYLSVPYPRDKSYASLMNQATSDGFLPDNTDLPGVYFVRADYDCDPSPTWTNFASSKSIALTLDCALGLTGFTSISGSQTLPHTNEDLVITDHLVIPSGSTVTYTNCDIRVASGMTITVETGATLNLIYSTSYNKPMRIIGCSSWGGIVVNGDPSSATSRGTLNITGTSDLIDISGAKIAIYSKTGGLVHVDGTRFSNNQNDLVFSGFSYAHNSTVSNSDFLGLMDKCSGCTSLVLNGLGADQESGNLIYLDGVSDIVIEDNNFSPASIEYVQSILNVSSTSYGISGSNCDDLTIRNNDFDGHHLTAMSFENSDGMVLHDNNYFGYIENAGSFIGCDQLEIGNTVSAGRSIMNFDGDNGLHFDDCDDLIIKKLDFESSTLDYGILVEDGIDILINDNKFDLDGEGAIGVQLYSKGASGAGLEVTHNQFIALKYGLITSPIENPLTASSNANLSTSAMYLSFTCNKFVNCEYGVIGSGKVQLAIGNATSGAENWFEDINATPSIQQGCVQWDILWQAGFTSVTGTLNYNYVSDNCVLQFGTSTYDGYIPNTNNSGRFGTLVMNGTSLGPVPSSEISLQNIVGCTTTVLPKPTIPASCYGSFKKGTGIDDLPKLEALKVELFPNPTEGDLLIESNYGINQITVFDINHRQVMAMDVDALKNTQLKTSALTEGVYLVQISTADQIVIRRLVKF